MANTIAVSFVAVVILVRALTSSQIAVGMTPPDCQVAEQLAQETRYGVESLASDPDRGKLELSAVATRWDELASNYTPGKYSWSTSGPEHGWLESLANVTAGLAKGEPPKVEQELNPAAYTLELVKLVPRFCTR